MPADVRVDGTAVRILASSHTTHAADLSSAAAALAAVPIGAVAEALGPVGTRFTAALAEAVAAVRIQAATLSDTAAAGAVTASAAAASYDDVQIRAAALICC
ncbi:hypothetical protein JRC04_09940 [Mycolicibacterium sp. S2-37]|uniref:type VII secretion target n=1 Tax=Mycolicibacterium sp. S2-37 TaxID=2810297 RepID=UPI001A9519C1|nr:type VII secretion target [Mycolicibacterium sp. S2-37]MBO0677783.1 hypothetical protein [Mycolicibacterium sp. S2-37]